MAGIILGYLSFATWFTGFLLARYVGGKNIGEPGRVRSHFIPVGKYRIHIHHWLWSSCAIVTFASFGGTYLLPPNLFYGFFGAIVFHGIYSYSDWYRVLIPRRIPELAITEEMVQDEDAFAAAMLKMKKKLELKYATDYDFPHFFPIHTVDPIEGSPVTQYPKISVKAE
ncbi:hypothetical protein ACFLXP_03720 [Chloroflexota bacterium]